MNICRLIGRLAFSFTGNYFDPKPGKQAFGNLSVRVGRGIYRGVLFGALATVFARTVKTGNLVRLQGFLRKREFETRDGVSKTALEIIADPDWTTVLEAEQFDEFENFEEAQKMAGVPAGDEAPAF